MQSAVARTTETPGSNQQFPQGWSECRRGMRRRTSGALMRRDVIAAATDTADRYPEVLRRRSGVAFAETSSSSTETSVSSLIQSGPWIRLPLSSKHFNWGQGWNIN
ncbi:hypothetical protein EYF80_009634 [Liparis tanakae]|uniref:Uncharacterized protein n=1 Tax=Liparis tanakae TaxID=230148 RepID=A0A4Z2ISF9_9TELE|nr:hypothetical protein EYF80_009634 [Liparis tanakae]